MEITLDLDISKRIIKVTHIITYLGNNEESVVVNNEDGTGVSLPFKGLSKETVELRDAYINALAIDIKGEYEYNKVTALSKTKG